MMATKAPAPPAAMYVVAAGFTSSLGDFDLFAPRIGSTWRADEPGIAQMLANDGEQKGFLVALGSADERSLRAARTRAEEVTMPPEPEPVAPVRLMRCIERTGYQAGWAGRHTGGPVPTVRIAEVGAIVPETDEIVLRYPEAFEPADTVQSGPDAA
jgi:hypothetical protein